MSWMDRFTGKPDPAVYEQWTFKPKTDITAYELATLLTKTEDANGPVFSDTLNLPIGSRVADVLGQDFERHFVKEEAPPC